MKKITIFIFLFILTIGFINGCQNRVQHFGTEYLIDYKGQNVTKHYSRSGHLLSEIVYADSVKGNYLFLKYDSNDVIMDSTPFINHKVEGLRFQLFHDTLIYGEYLKGIENGKHFEYLKPKQILCEGQMADGHKKGEWHFYHANGKLSAYEYFTFSGKNFFQENFSKNGNFLSVQGTPLIHGKWSDTISLGETFTAFYEIANPPIGKVKCYSGDIDKKDKIVNLKECSILTGDSTKYYSNEARIIYKPKAKGKTSVGVVWKLIQADTVLSKGELQINFFVK